MCQTNKIKIIPGMKPATFRAYGIDSIPEAVIELTRLKIED